MAKPVTPRKRTAGSRKPASAPVVDTTPVQPVANTARGEHELTLQGVTYRLRPSREALKAIEDRLKMSVLKLAQRGEVADLTLTQLGVIAEQLIRAGAEDEATRFVGAERLEELIQEESMARVTGRLTFCLADACTGGVTASGNVKPATA